MSKPLEEVDPDENPAVAAFQCIKFEEETPEGVHTLYTYVCACLSAPVVKPFCNQWAPHAWHLESYIIPWL